jgi:hypothetical protein
MERGGREVRPGLHLRTRHTTLSTCFLRSWDGKVDGRQSKTYLHDLELSFDFVIISKLLNFAAQILDLCGLPSQRNAICLPGNVSNS